jgi:hypothetical protein
MKPIAYRSPGLWAGAFNSVGICHVHIDGARDQELVLEIVKRLEAQGNLGKLNHVYDFVAGSQRDLEPETYGAHTPQQDDKEALDFFSTNLVKDRTDAVKVANLIMEAVDKIPGVIVELEQAVGWLAHHKWVKPYGYQIIPGREMEPVKDEEVSFQPAKTMKLEVHHGFDISGANPPVSLPKLLRYCESEGVVIGGWFLFQKKPRLWAYRSNSFTNQSLSEACEVAELERQKIDAFLESERRMVTPRTLLEKVVGIWKSQG